jgi:hypothetical protein
MPFYRFVMYSNDCQAEDLGIVERLNDADARSFCDSLILERMQTDPRFYAGWTMDIIEAGRAVASIPFNRRL